MDKIVIPDAAIREYNKKYGHLLPKMKKSTRPPTWIDEDKMFLDSLLTSSQKPLSNTVSEIAASQ